MRDTIRSLVDFRACSEASTRDIIAFFFNLLKEGKGEEDFLRWEEAFKNIHGTLDTQRRVDFGEIRSNYGVAVTSFSDLFRFIFSLETYYSIVLRLLGHKSIVNSPVEVKSLSAILSGEYLTERHILNYDCEHYYDWFLSFIDQKEVFQHLLRLLNDACLGEYDVDLIKLIFERLFPPKVRHSMGEFYTPDWLANYVNGRLTEHDSDAGNKRYLDPACGSGTFLLDLIQRFIGKAGHILHNIYGFDLSPLSALAAKTNILVIGRAYLRCLTDYYVLPVFNVDTINSPFHEAMADRQPSLFVRNDEYVAVDLSSQTVSAPKVWLSYDELKTVYILLCSGQIGADDLSKPAKRLYQFFRGTHLSRAEMSRLFSFFASFSLNDIDYIVGNPPWVNWEYLPKVYREQTKSLWHYYGFFELKGRDSSFIKEDISSLLTYVVLDRYLRRGGRLGFVIKETLFKSSKHGAGFRKFYLGHSDIPIRVIGVEGLSKIKPFTGVNNKPALVFLEKGASTKYPVDYVDWRLKRRKTFTAHDKLSKVLQSVVLEAQHTEPVNNDDSCSGWMVANPVHMSSIRKILGKSSYRARTGTFSGGANAVFWLNILEGNGKKVKIKNILAKAKRKVKEIEARLETEHVYPLLTGSDLHPWEYSYSKYILCPHTKDSRMEPINSRELTEFPLMEKYLNYFKDVLDERKGFAGWEKEIQKRSFYAIQRVGAYTFAEYKVAWRYISKRFIVAVIEKADDVYLGRKNIIPNEKIVYVGLSDRAEAYYLCGLLSSTLYREAIQSFMVDTQIAPYIMQNLNIPAFDPDNPYHVQLSELCENGHKSENKGVVIGKIDAIIDNLFDI